jgi:hypothetical protein
MNMSHSEGVATTEAVFQRYGGGRTSIASLVADRSRYLPAESDEFRESLRIDQYVFEIQTVGGRFRSEAAEEQLGESEDTIVTVSTWPLLWTHPEAEDEPFRGVFAPEREPPILFAEEVHVRTSQLPRGEPTIMINPFTMAMADDE